MAKKIVVTIGGDSDPYYVFTPPELEAEVAIIDWDEVNAGVFTFDQLLDLAEDASALAPHVAEDLREAAAKQIRGGLS